MTVSQLAPRQMTLDIEEEVFRHLLFHKALIDDTDEELYTKLDRYLSVLKDLKEGVHVTIKDSYSKSIAMVLELATEEYLDPWDVDLVKFCRMFMKKMKDTDRVNLMVVGKLIRMAYTVHLLKSQNTLKKAEMGNEDDRSDEDTFYDWMVDDEGFEVTKGILNAKTPVLVESIIHKGDRPVTLVDLLNALEDVEGEVEEFKNVRKVRFEERETLDRQNIENINSKVYKENTDEDIKLTWQRVNQFNGHPIPLSEIEQGFSLDAPSTFISLLFLAKWERIRVWQRSFPYGEIMVKNNVGHDDGELDYGDLDENLRKVREGEAVLMRRKELIVEEKRIPTNWNT